MYPFVAKVKGYSESMTKEYHYESFRTCMLIYAETFAEAMNQIEDYFGDELESCALECVGDFGTKFEIPYDFAQYFIKGEGNFSNGLQTEADTYLS